jgi:tetratricopeptide (TPR) repeat protein
MDRHKTLPCPIGHHRFIGAPSGASKSRTYCPSVLFLYMMIKLFITFLICFYPLYAHAEVITLLNGDTIEGTIVSEDKTSVTIDFEAGRMTFSKDTVASIRPSITLQENNTADKDTLGQSAPNKTREDNISTPFIEQNKEVTFDQEKNDFIFTYFGSKKVFEAAFEEMKAKRETDPANFGNRYQLGLAYYYLSDFEKALHELQAVLTHDPKDIEALLYLGHTYYQKGDIKNAIVALEKRIAIRPADYKSIQTLAFYYTQINEIHKAISLFEDVYKRIPSDRLVINNLIALYKRVGEDSKAVSMRHQLEEMDKAAL